MQKISIIVAVLLVGIVGCSGTDSDNISGTYKKFNGEATIKKLEKDKFSFYINTSVDVHSCNMGDSNKLIAVFDGKKNGSFKTEDGCQLIFEFSDNTLKLSSNNCQGYCGPKAIGSIDGAYSKSDVSVKKGSSRITPGQAAPVEHQPIKDPTKPDVPELIVKYFKDNSKVKVIRIENARTGIPQEKRKIDSYNNIMTTWIEIPYEATVVLICKDKGQKPYSINMSGEILQDKMGDFYIYDPPKPAVPGGYEPECPN